MRNERIKLLDYLSFCQSASSQKLVINTRIINKIFVYCKARRTVIFVAESSSQKERCRAPKYQNKFIDISESCTIPFGNNIFTQMLG